MNALEQLEKQIQTLLTRMKDLENENTNKDRIISGLSHDVHRLQNDLNSQRKKFKTDIQRLDSKINTIKR